MREYRVSVKEDRVSVRARVMEDRMREYRVSVKEDRVMEDRMREYRVCVRARVKEVFPCVVRLGVLFEKHFKSIRICAVNYCFLNLPKMGCPGNVLATVLPF